MRTLERLISTEACLLFTTVVGEGGLHFLSSNVANSALLDHACVDLVLHFSFRFAFHLPRMLAILVDVLVFHVHELVQHHVVGDVLTRVKTSVSDETRTEPTNHVDDAAWHCARVRACARRRASDEAGGEVRRGSFGGR